MNPYAVIVKPHVSEKTMNAIDLNNDLTFVVDRNSSKADIKRAFETLFEEQVERVNTHISPKGLKLAYIKLAEEEKAEDIAVKIGVF